MEMVSLCFEVNLLLNVTLSCSINVSIHCFPFFLIYILRHAKHIHNIDTQPTANSQRLQFTLHTS